jgi:hypothetical protein
MLTDLESFATVWSWGWGSFGRNDGPEERT